MKILILSLFVVASSAFAGDKVGNGGGLWVCSPNDQIQNAILVDFYEAENEFGLTLPSLTGADPFLLADQLGQKLTREMPGYGIRWSEIWREMKPKIRLVNSELVVIDDALFRIRPLPSMCRSGWQYVQFANYKFDHDVLIRKDLWESPAVDIREKVGLLWHEVVYRWMRDEFQDPNSSRARQIVGILFSDLSAEKMEEQIRRVVNVQEPVPGQPTWVCLIRGFDNATYSEYATTRVDAETQVQMSCRTKDTGNGAHCEQTSLACDSFTGTKPTHICRAYNPLLELRFAEKGRSAIEAEAKTMQACVRQGHGFHCEFKKCQAL